MSASLLPFSDEQLRVCANLEQRYDAWSEALRQRDEFPTSMYYASRGEQEYLIVKRHSRDNGTSEGPRSDATDLRLSRYREERATAQAAVEGTEAALAETVALYRSLKLPLMMPLPGRLLRELDLAGLLGSDVMAVGTNAFAVYQIEATARFAGVADETEDFDLAWCRDSGISPTRKGRRRPRFAKMTLRTPMATLPEQEWLLYGRPVRHVVATRDGKPAPIFAPDPRWMALHKLWLSEKPERNAAKKKKDRQQGEVLLAAVVERMQSSYPVDTDFVLDLPPELRPTFDAWAQAYRFMPMPPAGPSMR